MVANVVLDLPFAKDAGSLSPIYERNPIIDVPVAKVGWVISLKNVQMCAMHKIMGQYL